MLRRRDFLTFIMLIAVAIALYTQFPDVDKEKLAPINMGVWVLLLGSLLLAVRRVPAPATLIGMVCLYIFGYVFDRYVVTESILWSISPYIALIRIPILVFSCAYCITCFEQGERTIKAIMGVFTVITIVMSVMIASKFVTDFSMWQHTEQYLYDGSTHKNSTAQVIGCGLVSLLFFYSPTKLWKRAIRYASMAVMIMALLYVQSRAVLTAIAGVAILSIILQRENKKRMVWGLAIVAIIIILAYSQTSNDVIRQAYMIDKYSRGSAVDVNRLSSGRVDYWQIKWGEFLDHPLTGIGSSYCDNFYINALASGGIFFGGGLIFLYLYRVYRNAKLFFTINKHDIMYRAYQTGVAISLFYLIISIFEAYPPYGPGVSTMLFWILSGYMDGYEMFARNTLDDNEVL